MYIKNKLDLNSTKDHCNMTTRNNNFEFLESNTNNLYVYNKNGTLISKEQLDKNYIVLTFNDNENTYLTSTCAHTNHFEKLRRDYKKIENFVIKTDNSKFIKINDIFFDRKNSKYLIADDRNIYSIDQNGNFLNNEICTKELFENTSCCCCNECCSNNNCCNERFVAIGSDGIYKYAAYTKNSSSYISKFSKNGALINKMFVDDNTDILSIGINNGIYLGVKKNQKNFIYELAEKSKVNYIDPRISDVLDKILTQLNTVSISENSISSLINSEAYKIKKILEISTDTNEILAVNNSVKETLKEAVTLDTLQKDNLKILLESLKELENIINTINE